MSLLQKYASLLEQNEALEKENAELKAWKESALILNAEMDEQALAKMLGGKLGLSCRKIIAEEVPKLVEENAILREDSRMLEWLLEQNVALRDYFAGQALAGLLAQIPGDSRRIAVGLAYRLADEMLVEREQNGAQP